MNLGTPDTAKTSDVRRYLREFLSDARVIDLPPIRRWLLLNLVILPFRPRTSAEAYRKIWTAGGSPLFLYGLDLVEKLSAAFRGDVQVELAMRYQNPSIRAALTHFRKAGVERIVAFPLFPQYSSAAWGSAVEKVFEEAGRLWNVPSIQVVPQFFDHPAFIDSWATVARPVITDLGPDRVIMSFHGLPERHIRKSDEAGGTHCLASGTCCDEIVSANRYCYRAQCFATAREIASRLSLNKDDYEVTFQSRLGRSPWIKPYTDVRIRELAQAGVKRVAVLCPSFVADCLETIEEIGLRARDDFLAHGGEELRLVSSLNAHDSWVRAILDITRDALGDIGVPDENSVMC